MTWPAPRPGLVVRFSYLWKREADAGREEGVKDRPCAVVIEIKGEGGHPRVIALPITHSRPQPPDEGIELPQQTKTRLGLDGERLLGHRERGQRFCLARSRSSVPAGIRAGQCRLRISAAACVPCRPRSVSCALPAPPGWSGHPHGVMYRPRPHPLVSGGGGVTGFSIQSGISQARRP